jgi:hypothetical protein
MSDGFRVRVMRPDEVELAADWAAAYPLSLSG